MTKIRRRSLIAIGILGLCLGLGILVWRLSMWEDYDGTVRGTFVEGDLNAPETRWWNHWYLAKWGWKTVAVFEVPAGYAAAGYDVGYRPFNDSAKVEGEVNHERHFRMKIGHEGCTFFAVSLVDGKEIPIKLVARTTIDDAAYHDAPLH